MKLSAEALCARIEDFPHKPVCPQRQKAPDGTITETDAYKNAPYAEGLVDIPASPKEAAC